MLGDQLGVEPRRDGVQIGLGRRAKGLALDAQCFLRRGLGLRIDPLHPWETDLVTPATTTLRSPLPLGLARVPGRLARPQCTVHRARIKFCESFTQCVRAAKYQAEPGRLGRKLIKGILFSGEA
jgi:hypothetical protein